MPDPFPGIPLGIPTLASTVTIDDGTRSRTVTFEQLKTLLVTVAPTPTGPSINPRTLVGTYAPNSAGSVTAFETWLGRKIDIASVHTGEASAADFINSIDFCIGANAYPGPGMKAVSLPLIWDGGTLAEAAAGLYDSLYTQAATKILAKLGAQPKIYLRTGWEQNLFGLMPWASDGKEADFITAFRRLVNCARAVDTGNKFRFVYGPNIGGTNPALSYPGRAFVDLIGMDVYWFPEFGDPAEPYYAFQTMRTKAFGLNWLETFATQENLPMCFPEVGVKLDVRAGVTDGDYMGPYVKLFIEWCEARNVEYFSWWNSNGDYASRLDAGAMPKLGAWVRHALNPDVYPDRPPETATNYWNNASDFRTGWNNFVDKGTLTFTQDTLTFVGAGGVNQNRGVQQFNLPPGDYVQAATVTRLSGTMPLAMSIFTAGIDAGKKVFYDTTALPIGVPKRIAIPVSYPSGMSSFKPGFNNNSGLDGSFQFANIGVWRGVDPFAPA